MDQLETMKSKMHQLETMKLDKEDNAICEAVRQLAG